MGRCGCLLLILALVGCNRLEKTSSKRQEDRPNPTPVTAIQEPSPPARFLPTGDDPEVALDTQRGTLCRTVPARPGSKDKYTQLEMCNKGETSSPIAEFDPTLGDIISFDANCYLTKNLLPAISEADPSKKQVVPTCIIANMTNKELPLMTFSNSDALFHLPDGTVRHVDHTYLASSEKTVPAKGRIEGGLWLDGECDVKQSDADCVKSRLMNAREILLTDTKTGLRYRIRMNRDDDPLGVLN